jgi:uncharacterized protein (DUF736 family)
MATIGTFTKTENGFSGNLHTLAVKAKVIFEKNGDKQSDSHPDYSLVSGSTRIGAAWERTGKKGRYISVSFDDPGFAPGYYNLTKTGVELTYSLTFERRPRAKKAD